MLLMVLTMVLPIILLMMFLGEREMAQILRITSKLGARTCHVNEGSTQIDHTRLRTDLRHHGTRDSRLTTGPGSHKVNENR